MAKYAIDLDKLMKWVSTTPSSEKNVATTITQIIPIIDEESNVDDDSIANFSTKEITENKDTLNDTMNNIRYDIIKLLLNTLFSSVDHLNSSSLQEVLSIQQRICFNTLLNKGIIIELKD